jgi:hypothetical protein
MNEEWGRLPARSRKKPIMTRFMNKVASTPEGCWEWQGAKGSTGYGLFFTGNRTQQAHRVSYELFKGKFDSQMAVHHTCHKRDCVNPNHLTLITTTIS